jgi:hypothetical protein
MKKVLLSLAIIATLGVKAQTDTTGLTTRIVDKFKTSYVKEYFKDPYSFQLLSIAYAPITREVSIRSKIVADSIQLEACSKYKVLLRKEIKVLVSNLETNNRLLAALSEAGKQEIEKYTVLIECRGANSYGGIVYSKKVGYYYSDTDILEIL